MPCLHGNYKFLSEKTAALAVRRVLTKAETGYLFKDDVQADLN